MRRFPGSQPCQAGAQISKEYAEQKAFCFPDETGNSWVADNVACFGGVDENDFWSCAARYGQWLGLKK